MTINIIQDKCVACGACIKVCPFAALELKGDLLEVYPSCTLCGLCIDACKFDALEMPERTSSAADNRDSHRGVWVFVQPQDGGVHHVTVELVGEGRVLADALDTELCCMVLSDDAGPLIDVLSHYDIDRLFVAEHAELSRYRTAPFVDAAAALIRAHKPEIVLIGATSTGRDFAGGLATELKTGLTADCTALAVDVETRGLLQTRPAFGGNIMATIMSHNHRPQMATVRPKVFAMPEPGKAHDIDSVRNDVVLDPADALAEILEWIPSEDAVPLADADIIIAGGRGLGKPENFAMLHDLADVLGGTVGASRAAVDEGWIDYSHQVGQTGRTVRPKIYIACGISGAIQHLAGMKTADVIIAINRDKDAPIFSVATYGFVGDVHDIVPKLIEKLKR